MTDLSTEPVAVQAPPAPPSPPPQTASVPAQAAPELEHTPGGWPVVPLALSGANTTVGMVAAASLAGGPVAAVAAATGAAVLGTVAAVRSRRPNPRREARRAAVRAAGRTAARAAGLRSSGTGSRTGGRSLASRAGGSGGRSGRVPGQQRRGTGPTGRQTSTTTGGSNRSRASHGATKPRTGATEKQLGRVGQAKVLRAAQQAAAGSRAGQRAQTTAARRAVADARRNAKTSSGAGLTSRAGRRSLAGRTLGAAARTARDIRDAAISKNRAARDRKTAATVAAQRGTVRKAPARRAARKALRRSAARFQGRRLLAALLSLPAGVLGCLTTPLGRKFNVRWLMYPGRRLYRRLVATAAAQRTARDAAIRQQQAEQEAAADAEVAQDASEGIGDRVQRPPAQIPNSTPTPATSQVSEGVHVSGFRFEEAAAEMEEAAQNYEPDGAMEILAMVEGLPIALASVAEVMKILGERSDEEFPLEKAVAETFRDCYGAVMAAVAVAEEMGPIFRKEHEQDIARHEDPRNGHEAEKGWNV
ncbi:hypothetical protein [Streptomyces sp. NPDC001816]|uniref:hypothetical protein n=1 Tax=Streptomyces sp. NPDC001816 TaxID=3364612 RepID=UPI0036B49FAC